MSLRVAAHCPHLIKAGPEISSVRLNWHIHQSMNNPDLTAIGQVTTSGVKTTHSHTSRRMLQKIDDACQDPKPLSAMRLWFTH